MRKASDLHELNQREQILLELFNRMDTNDQKGKLCVFIGYLCGRGIISEEESVKYLKSVKQKD